MFRSGGAYPGVSLLVWGFSTLKGAEEKSRMARSRRADGQMYIQRDTTPH